MIIFVVHGTHDLHTQLCSRFIEQGIANIAIFDAHRTHMLRKSVVSINAEGTNYTLREVHFHAAHTHFEDGHACL